MTIMVLDTETWITIDGMILKEETNPTTCLEMRLIITSQCGTRLCGTKPCRIRLLQKTILTPLLTSLKTIIRAENLERNRLVTTKLMMTSKTRITIILEKIVTITIKITHMINQIIHTMVTWLIMSSMTCYMMICIMIITWQMVPEEWLNRCLDIKMKSTMSILQSLQLCLRSITLMKPYQTGTLKIQEL